MPQTFSDILLCYHSQSCSPSASSWIASTNVPSPGTAPAVTAGMGMKQAVMGEAAQVINKFTVTSTPRGPDGSLLALRGRECWTARTAPLLPHPSPKMLVRDKHRLLGRGMGKSVPKMRVSASLLALWYSCAPEELSWVTEGSAGLEEFWSSSSVVWAALSPHFPTRTACKTCRVSPHSHKVTPRLEFDKWTLPRSYNLAGNVTSE